MLYSLIEQLDWFHDVPGSRLMTYITFRSGIAFVLSLFIAVAIGKKIIERLQMMQVGEIIRNLDLEGQSKKKGTPTMGGVIIILAILFPCLIVGNLQNIYMVLMLIATIWLGFLGFMDDFLKLRRHNKDGMSGKYKIVGQVGLGLMVGLTMYLSPQIVMRQTSDMSLAERSEVVQVSSESDNIHAPQTTIPFVKNNNLDYTSLTKWMGKHAETAGWILFIFVTIFFVTATSNGANLTDGLDGLAAGCSAIIGTALAIMAYLGANVIYSTYLDIMYIPGSEELVVYMAAFIGALIGFLWYNCNPAQVFMGDTGSLTLGGIIAVFAILIRKELMLIPLCAIFYVEDFSVICQTAFFKLTRRFRGQPKRLLKMAPLHHHFQKRGDGSIDAVIQKPYAEVPEPKIVVRFWIVGILLAVLTFVTLKVR